MWDSILVGYYVVCMSPKWQYMDQSLGIIPPVYRLGLVQCCIHDIMFSCLFTNKVKYLVCGSIAHQILQNDGYGILCRVVYKKKNTSTPAAS